MRSRSSELNAARVAGAPYRSLWRSGHIKSHRGPTESHSSVAETGPLERSHIWVGLLGPAYASPSQLKKKDCHSGLSFLGLSRPVNLIFSQCSFGFRSNGRGKGICLKGKPCGYRLVNSRPSLRLEPACQAGRSCVHQKGIIIGFQVV